MIIKDLSAKSIPDSRKEKTIFVTIKTSIGNFSASAPNGKSKGKYEKPSYKKNLEGDIKKIKEVSDYFSEENIESFEDLKRVEDVIEGFVGANTLFALESAVLKALAKEQKKEVWQLINPNANAKIRFVGNAIGGGKHSHINSDSKKPDFQEFLIIPQAKTAKESFEKNERVKKNLKNLLKEKDEKFKGLKNDEDAWITSLNEKEVFEIIKSEKIPFGADVAASSFYNRKKYNYQNPMFPRNKEEQLNYVSNLIKNFDLFYIEDPFEEDDFESFAKLLKKFPNTLIVGDDLTVTNPKRLEKAIEMKSINAIIVKPNQIGSMTKVAEVCKMAKEKEIKIVFSHRSGETMESILADLAFGFEANFLKCGITGKEREVKIKRLIEIEGLR
ncbi:hypothetical protein COU59_00345 [Candidatus Pacearchaeota archaeon CG10_big_fil_rev_8_21_14_0_10_34_12]|nr:MAG: hypothetical protein COU59_00345 [Candidatus Pacearchaeota archaeon CG10_big_fil_rev_8_21_14_0_10_34_12]